MIRAGREGRLDSNYPAPGATGRVREVSPANMYVYEYYWSPDGGSFVPRRRFGRYIRKQLHDALRRQSSVHLELLHGSVASITQEPRNLRLHIEGGHDIGTNIAVLALGNHTITVSYAGDSRFTTVAYLRCGVSRTT